jgi:hypothetical protein
MNCKNCGKPVPKSKRGNQSEYCDNGKECYTKWYYEHNKKRLCEYQKKYSARKKMKIVLEEHSAIKDIEKRLKANQAELTRNVNEFYKPVDHNEKYQPVYEKNLTEKKYPSVMAERIVI